ncbi:MAG TPA: FAD/NAD(P)-binding oxidoreductase, partial [Pseudonocardiaceae bacterium]
MNADRYDVLVIGAGPAGMAAACTAAEAGSRVVVVDAAGSPGGQFWRNADAGPRLHHRHGAYRRLRARATTAGVRLAAEHTVQTVRADADGFTLACAVGAEPRTAQELTTLRGHRLIIAIGAYDRQMPFPGWDLPGVLAAGGVQALLKAHGVRAGARVVVAGTGPLLLPVADALIRSGARVPAILDANSPTGFARHPAALAGSIGKLGEAAGYAARLALARTPYPRRQAVVAALGDERIEAVRVAR